MLRPFAFLFALLVASAPAQGRLMNAADIQRAANFAAQIQKVYEKARDMNRKMDGAKDYVDAFRSGEVEAEAFAEAFDPFLDGMRAAVESYRKRYPRAPLPPSIGSPPYEKILARFAETVVDLGAGLDRQLELLRRMRDAALGGDDGQYDAAVAGMLGVTRQMILAENASLEAALVSMERRDPRYGLTTARIGDNKVLEAALRISQASRRGAEFDAGEMALTVETALRDASRGIVDGEHATGQMLKDLEGKYAKTNEDRRWAVHVGQMAEAYKRAFAVERAIVETERTLLDYLRAVNAGDDSQDSAQDLVADFRYELADQLAQRAAETDIRRQMTAQYESSIETAQ